MDKDFFSAYMQQPLLGVLVFREERLVRANNQAAKLFGTGVAELLTWSFADFLGRVHPGDKAKVLGWSKWELGDKNSVSYRLKNTAGIYLSIDGFAQEVALEGKASFALTLLDVTARARLEVQQALGQRVMGVLHRPGLPLAQCLSEILEHIKEGLGLDAAGLRLRIDGQFATFETAGAANLFHGQDRRACEPLVEGKDCLCSRLLRRELPHLPCFSKGGSFISDDYHGDLERIEGLVPLIAHDRCVRGGYSSIAQVPIRALGSSLGILHLANKTPMGLSPENAKFLEELGEFIGLATVRHLNAEALQRTKESAEANNRAKDEFLATMSHEIRTPMNAILGFADLLSDAALGDDHREYLNIIKTRGQDLLAIIDDILDLARIEADKMRLIDEPFRIRESIASAISLLRPRAEHKGLNLGSKMDPGIPDFVRGDSLRLRQVLINLLSNAIKFTSAGEVLVEVAIAFPPRDNTIGLTFAVSDTGIGISPADIQRIFAPFVQVESKRARSYGGVGLGLNIVKHLVDRMGGEIQVESALGQGSNFHFNLPFQLPGARTVSGSHSQLASISAPLALLLVDDDITSRILFGAMLRRDGHTVVEAADGQQAIHAVRDGDFDLVLMDVQMPVLDGLGATQAIRAMGKSSTPELQRRSAVPIVALTAHAMRGDEEACLAAGMNGYLRKPLQAESLRACLRAYALSR